MAGRKYQLRKRAEGLDATRERIVEATAALHYEQGVAATSYVQIAERAGVGLSLRAWARGSSVWNASLPSSMHSMAAVQSGLESRPATGTACPNSTGSCGRSRLGWRRWSGRQSEPGLRKL